jgi:hypothetical protein
MQKVAAVQRPATAYLNCVHCKVIADGAFQIFEKRSGKTLHVYLLAGMRAMCLSDPDEALSNWLHMRALSPHPHPHSLPLPQPRSGGGDRGDVLGEPPLPVSVGP